MRTEQTGTLVASPPEKGTVSSSRRTVLRTFLGGGILASLGSFLYPVLRYLVPPVETNLGVDSVMDCYSHSAVRVIKDGRVPERTICALLGLRSSNEEPLT